MGYLGWGHWNCWDDALQAARNAHGPMLQMKWLKLIHNSLIFTVGGHRAACFGWWQSSSICRKVQQKGFSMIFQIVYPWNFSKDAQGDFRCGVETNFQTPSCHHKLKGDKPLILKILKWRTEFFRLHNSMLNFQDILRRISQYPKTPQANTFSRKFSHGTLERRHPHRCHAIQGPRPFRP